LLTCAYLRTAFPSILWLTDPVCFPTDIQTSSDRAPTPTALHITNSTEHQRCARAGNWHCNDQSNKMARYSLMAYVMPALRAFDAELRVEQRPLLTCAYLRAALPDILWHTDLVFPTEAQPSSDRAMTPTALRITDSTEHQRSSSNPGLVRDASAHTSLHHTQRALASHEDHVRSGGTFRLVVRRGLAWATWCGAGLCV